MEIDYDGRGLREEVRRYSASVGGTQIGSSAYEYDNGGRLIGLDHIDASSAPIVQYSYAYDEANRLTLETRNGVTKTYTYDATNQLKSDGTKAYDYDKNGNRTMAGYEIEEANRITTDGIWTYTYSDTGAILAKTLNGGSESWEYTYDLRNQMLSAERIVNGITVLTVTYGYDVFGYQVSRTETVAGNAASVTKFAYDISDRGSAYSTVVSAMWAELDATGNLTMRYFLGDSEGEKLARSNATEVTWMLTDRLGSIRELTDGDGVVGREISYDGFGNVASSTGTIDAGRFLYAGYMWDSAVGLYNAHWRWYDASIGQWTSEDPIGFTAGDANIRRYVGNGATNGTDRSGLEVPGFNHFYPLYLGGSDNQPVFELSKENHTKAHDVFRKYSVGMKSGVTWDQARTNWAKLSVQEQKVIVLEAMKAANIHETAAKHYIDEVFKGASPGVNNSPTRGARSVSRSISKERIEQFRKAAALATKAGCAIIVFGVTFAYDSYVQAGEDSGVKLTERIGLGQLLKTVGDEGNLPSTNFKMNFRDREVHVELIPDKSDNQAGHIITAFHYVEGNQGTWGDVKAFITVGRRGMPYTEKKEIIPLASKYKTYCFVLPSLLK